MSKVTCYIGSKTFVFDYEGKDVVIREYGRKYSSAAFVSITLSRWIATEMGKIIEKFEEGFVTKKRDNEKLVMLSIRKNNSGLYISIFIISTTGKKSNMALCVPHSSNGWETFTKALRKIIPEKATPPWIQKEVSLEVVGGNRSLLIRKRYADLVDNLSTSAVIASFNNYSYSWKHLVGDLVCMFEFSKEPTISVIGGNSFLVTCHSPEDANQILSLQKMVIDGCVISFGRWKPCSGTLQASRHTCRWIELIGLPVHLINKAVIDEICSSFGRIKTIDSLMGVPNRINCIQIELMDVDVLKIPHYVSVIDQGVAYLVRISVSIHELYPIRKNRVKHGRKDAPPLTTEPAPDPDPGPAPDPALSKPAVPPNSAPPIPKPSASIPPLISHPRSPPIHSSISAPPFPLAWVNTQRRPHPFPPNPDPHITLPNPPSDPPVPSFPKPLPPDPSTRNSLPNPIIPEIVSPPVSRSSPSSLQYHLPTVQPSLPITTVLNPLSSPPNPPPPTLPSRLFNNCPPNLPRHSVPIPNHILPLAIPSTTRPLSPLLPLSPSPSVLAAEVSYPVDDEHAADASSPVDVVHAAGVIYPADDDLVSDSGDDDDDYLGEDDELPDKLPQGEDVVQFITKKLAEVSSIIDEYQKNGKVVKND